MLYKNLKNVVYPHDKFWHAFTHTAGGIGRTSASVTHTNIAVWRKQSALEAEEEENHSSLPCTIRRLFILYLLQLLFLPFSLSIRGEKKKKELWFLLHIGILTFSTHTIWI